MTRDPNSSSIANGLKTEVRRMRMRIDGRTGDARRSRTTELLQTAGIPAARPAMRASEQRERASGAARAAKRRASDAVGESEERSPSAEVDPRWTSPDAVAGFVASPPNDVLMRFAAEAARGVAAPTALDIGCGAGRNAIPLAREGWRVAGTDLSWPMLMAADRRLREEAPSARVLLAHAPMQALPIASNTVDLVVAHGI